MLNDGDRYRFRFCCSISGAQVHTSDWIQADEMKKALQIAWETEGRAHFNRCQKCGRWVSDVMYNADVLECVACAPWEDMPNFCPHCGKKLSAPENCCSSCGAHLRYEGR